MDTNRYLKYVLATAAAAIVAAIVLGIAIWASDDHVSASESESQARGHGFPRTPGVAPITRDGDEGVQVDVAGQKCTFVFYGGAQNQDSSASFMVVTDATTGDEFRVDNPWINSIWSNKAVATHC